MKIALCFIISYEHILKKEQIWMDWIKPNKDIINIYFHYKDINLIQSPWIKRYTIPPDFVQNTSYYNVVPAYMALLTYAFNHDTDNLWFCLLTDSCVPIISPQKFRKRFFDHYQASIITCKPAYWNINIHRRANLWLLKKEYWLANDPWFTLSRQHVHQCILFLVIKQDTFKTVNSGGLANESIFAIILRTFQEVTTTSSSTLINESSTICDWTHMSSPTSPHIFRDANPENLAIITHLLQTHKYAMFLRKVDSTFPDEALKTIIYSTEDYGHTYDVLHNQAKKKHSHKYNYMSYILSHLVYFFPLLSVFTMGIVFFRWVNMKIHNK